MKSTVCLPFFRCGSTQIRGFTAEFASPHTLLGAVCARVAAVRSFWLRFGVVGELVMTMDDRYCCFLSRDLFLFLMRLYLQSGGLYV